MEQPAVIVAEGKGGRRNSLQRILEAQLPDTLVLAVTSTEALLARAQSDARQCLVIDEDFCGAPHSPELLVEKLREARSTHPVLWVLGRESDPGARDALFGNARDDFILRPIRPAELSRRVARMLAMTSRAPELQQANRVLAAVVEERSHDLYESDERFRLLFNACIDGVCTVALGGDKEGDQIIEVNSQLCHALNYPREEILAMLPKDLVDPHHIKAMNARLRTLAVEKQFYIETILVTRDGQKLPAAITARHFSFSRQPYIIFVVHFRARGEAGAPGRISSPCGQYVLKRLAN